MISASQQALMGTLHDICTDGSFTSEECAILRFGPLENAGLLNYVDLPSVDPPDF
jgi:hypothetical protein